MLKILSILFILNSVLFAQLIELNPLSLGFDHVPQSKMISRGVGSVGFDNADHVYNPKYNFTTKYVSFSASYLSDIKTESDLIVHSNSYPITENLDNTSWDLGLQLKFLSFNLNVNYFNNIIFHQRFLHNITKTLESDKGNITLALENTLHQITHRIIQFSLVKNLSEHSSLAIAILTNNFEYQMNSENNKSLFDYSEPFFGNIQYLASYNHSFPFFDFYVLLRTQNSLEKLETSGYIYKDNRQYTHKPYISFPGNFGYGVQFKVTSGLTSSIEMKHEFLFTEDDAIVFKRYDYTTEREHYKGLSIFNTELNWGIKYNILTYVDLGLLLNYSLDNDYQILTDSDEDYFKYKIDQYYTLIPSLRFTYNFLALSFYYQYTKLTYENLANTHREDVSQLFKINFSVNY